MMVVKKMCVQIWKKKVKSTVKVVLVTMIQRSRQE
jgi:hypothetical protein